MKRRDELRDIYQTGGHDFEKDFTPQVAQEIIDQRQRDLLRSRVYSMLLGGVAIVLAVALVAVAARSLLTGNKAAPQPRPEERTYIPRHSLASEASWVISYQQLMEQSDFAILEEPGEKPLSTMWVQKAAYHIVVGQQALSLNKLNEALDHFNKVVEIFPTIEGIHHVMGTLYIQKEDYAEAAKHLELAFQEEESFETANNLGTAYIGTQDYPSAEKYLKRALELQPEAPSAHKNLAVLYRDMDRSDDAVYHFEKYLDLHPDDIETLQSYALFLTRQGRWDEASEFLEKLTQEVTDDAPIYFLLAQVQVQNGEHEKAIETLKRGMQLVDPSLALAWMGKQEFNDVRETDTFQKLMDELEIATISLDP